MRLLATLIFLAGCAAPQRFQPLSLTALHAPLSSAIAIAESGDDVLILEDHTATLVRRGTAINIADSRRWRAAAALPAADGTGVWLTAIDSDGMIHRLHDGRFEPIADRYGISQVRAACSPAKNVSAFLLDHAVAVADGHKVIRWPVATQTLVCGGGRIAGATKTAVVVFDIKTGSENRYPFKSVAVALDDNGRLYAANKRGIYMENGGVLALRYTAEAEIDGLAAGQWAWFSDGKRLGLLDDKDIYRSQTDMKGRLQTAGTDVWILGTHLEHYSRRDMQPAPQERWATVVAPVFTRSCSQCHLAGGKAGVDLSTAPAWQSRRELLRQRLLVDRDMPPPGHTLADIDRAALADWLQKN